MVSQERFNMTEISLIKDSRHRNGMDGMEEKSRETFYPDTHPQVAQVVGPSSIFAPHFGHVTKIDGEGVSTDKFAVDVFTIHSPTSVSTILFRNC